MKKDFVSLAEARPDLAKEWNYEKNGDLKPEDVSCGSGKKVWWKLPYDVPDNYPVEHLRGKHFDFEWEAAIFSRNDGNGCPFLSGKAAWIGFNDLATINPELAAQWHPTKNGDLKPTQVTANANKKVWWKLPYEVPADYPIVHLRGKHFDFEWEASIGNRIRGTSCPFLCQNPKVWKGFNDLATTNPSLAEEWDYKLNIGLTPSDITANSGKNVWWMLRYNVPNDYPVESLRGRFFKFEWITSVYNRSKGDDCPYLSGRAVWPGFNDLATINPELAAQWHPTKNGDLKPTQVTINSNKKVWWLYPYDDPNTGKHFEFEWTALINDRKNGNDCPFLSGKAVWPGFNDLATINPELAARWHPTKNEDLKPTQVTVDSNKKVWWMYPYDDPNTGKHFEFEWESSIHNRNKGNGCPYLSGQAVWSGFNDLATINQELAAQWHPTKNKNLKPTQVTANTNKKVWWMYPYDDPNTGKHFEFEWESSIHNRNKGSGCPYLTTYKGEEYIKQYLQKNNISFDVQQKFTDLLGSGDGQLSYDFSIPDEKYGHILIEYNGIQHYEVVEYFGGEEKFKIQKEHDKRKRDYAKKHGYKLITVKYTYDTYESIAEYLDKELKKLGVIDDNKREGTVDDAA